jgi:hypothetical protein
VVAAGVVVLLPLEMVVLAEAVMVVHRLMEAPVLQIQEVAAAVLDIAVAHYLEAQAVQAWSSSRFQIPVPQPSLAV